MKQNSIGKFITFEGGEGSGKSTQVKAIVTFLRHLKIEVVQTREPGGSEGAESLRDLLVKGASNRWSPIAETLMMYAARADHVEKLIRPAIAQGKWVICDRFADSTRAYQGAAGGVDPQLIEAIDAATVGHDQPDLTFVLDLPAEIGLARAARRGDSEQRFESKGIIFHQKLRQAFINRAVALPERYVLIDATLPQEAITQTIVTALLSHFPQLKMLDHE